ncbi:MAG: hypothetical protein NT098_00460 [Candidatus Parcubacteria bacterium]|nr:hypothetical protein [Candidatus Parcubacteria bacterium]
MSEYEELKTKALENLFISMGYALLAFTKKSRILEMPREKREEQIFSEEKLAGQTKDFDSMP